MQCLVSRASGGNVMEWGRGQGWLAVGGGCEEALKVPDRLFVLCVFFFLPPRNTGPFSLAAMGIRRQEAMVSARRANTSRRSGAKTTGGRGLGACPWACVCRATTLGSQGRWLGLLEVRCIGYMCEWPGREPRLSNGNRQRKEGSVGGEKGRDE